jgi:hypothetical protein
LKKRDEQERHNDETLLSSDTERDVEMSMNIMYSPSGSRYSIECETENPLFAQPRNSLTTVVSGLSIDRSVYNDKDLMKLNTDLDHELTLLNDICQMDEIDLDPCEITERANVKLDLLEELATERAGGQLWGIARKIVRRETGNCSDAWSDLLDRIKTVRANLKTVEKVSRERSYTDDKNEWIRSLKSKLRPVQRD